MEKAKLHGNMGKLADGLRRDSWIVCIGDMRGPGACISLAFGGLG